MDEDCFPVTAFLRSSLLFSWFIIPLEEKDYMPDLSLLSFITELLSNPMLLVTLILTLAVTFVNGWTDACHDAVELKSCIYDTKYSELR